MQIQDVLPPDAIPSVDDPSFEPVEAYEGRPDDEVILLELDETRVYPIRYLNYHEIVTDTVGETPVAVTWCPLCGSVLVFDRRVDGRTLTFGVSGKLADDTLVMYDHQTESLWKQSLGRAIEGPLEGTELELLPAAVTTYATVRESHPDASVLARPEPGQTATPDADRSEYDDNRPPYDDDPYRDYFDGEGFGLAARRDPGDGRSFPLDWLDAKEPVLGIERGDDALGFPRSEVADAGGVVTAIVGESAVLVVDAPDGIHAYDDPGGEWKLIDGRLVAGGRAYDPTTGRALGEDDPTDGDGSVDGAGRTEGADPTDGDDRLDRVPAIRLFAFGWYDNHGPDAFYRTAE